MVCCSFATETGYNDDSNRVCDFYLGIESFYFRQINRLLSARKDRTKHGLICYCCSYLYSQTGKEKLMSEKGHNKSFLSFSFVLPIVCFVKLSVSYALLFFNCRNKLL